jgi:hypothetical protein
VRCTGIKQRNCRTALINISSKLSTAIVLAEAGKVAIGCPEFGDLVRNARIMDHRAAHFSGLCKFAQSLEVALSFTDHLAERRFKPDLNCIQCRFDIRRRVVDEGMSTRIVIHLA